MKKNVCRTETDPIEKLYLKDDIKLKDLEDFGFDIRTLSEEGKLNFTNEYIDDNYRVAIKGNVFIYECTREVQIHSTNMSDIETLYFLIQYGLVERG